MTVYSRGRRSPIEISTKSVVVSPQVLGEDTWFFFRFLTSSVATWCKAALNLSQEEITPQPARNVSGSPGAGRPAVEGGADRLLGELTKTVLRFQRESRIQSLKKRVGVLARRESWYKTSDKMSRLISEWLCECSVLHGKRAWSRASVDTGPLRTEITGAMLVVLCAPSQPGGLGGRTASVFFLSLVPKEQRPAWWMSQQVSAGQAREENESSLKCALHRWGPRDGSVKTACEPPAAYRAQTCSPGLT